KFLFVKVGKCQGILIKRKTGGIVEELEIYFFHFRHLYRSGAIPICRSNIAEREDLSLKLVCCLIFIADSTSPNQSVRSECQGNSGIGFGFYHFISSIVGSKSPGLTWRCPSGGNRSKTPCKNDEEKNTKHKTGKSCPHHL